MKLSFVFGAAILGVALSGSAQQVKTAKPLRTKPSNEFRVNEGGTGGKSTGALASPARSSSASTKQLRQIEAERVKKTSSHTTRKLPATGLNERQKNTPRINVKGNLQGKSELTKGNQGRSPKQKGHH